MLRSAVVVIVLAGCAAIIGPRSYDEATTHAKAGPSRYTITANGNGENTQSDVFSFIHRRAAALCRYGYDILDGTKGLSESLVVVGKYAEASTSHDAAALIQCRRKQPAVARWVCHSASHLCTTSVDGCATFSYGGGGKCTTATEAWCFDGGKAGDPPTPNVLCFDSAATCYQGRQLDVVVASSDCNQR